MVGASPRGSPGDSGREADAQGTAGGEVAAGKAGVPCGRTPPGGSAHPGGGVISSKGRTVSSYKVLGKGGLAFLKQLSPGLGGVFFPRGAGFDETGPRAEALWEGGAERHERGGGRKERRKQYLRSFLVF